ncbi:SDR family oxidoreductase [Myxococcota bacterium]|nr:SDR family oxidoreductase [Myxococcota bacterium]
MPSLEGKIALVTGATSGIGLEAAVELARLGANVVVVGRNAERGRAARDEITRRSGSERVELMLCDFARQADIRRLAADYRAKHDRLDLLINNAGSVSDTREVTPDGIEQTFAVNHLGYFLLTKLLLDLVEKSAPARIVNVASVGHRKGDLDFDDLQFEKGGYWIMKAYARSKLANVMFTRELAKRLDPSRVTVNCLHPGAVATNIWSFAPTWARPILSVAKLFMDTPKEGGDRIVFLATSPDVEGKTGGYYEKNRLVLPSRLAQDDALAKRLWDTSEALVGG